MVTENVDTTVDVLYRIKRGLAGYISYLAACEMNAAFSEYILYEPILRILTARGFLVRSEVECPGYDRNARGDVKRLDFVARGNGSHFALEMKWARISRPKVQGDLEKLRKYQVAYQEALCFLCIFGRKSVLSAISVPPGLRERGSAIYAEFGRTRFGCRVFEVIADVPIGGLR